MKGLMSTYCWIAQALIAAAVMAVAEPVDPRNPAEWRAMQAADRTSISSWLPARIRQLENERVELIGKISQLPQHAPKPLSDHLGFHSLPLPETESRENDSGQIDVQFQFDPQLGAVALVPAFVPGENGGYAFPKRFKIEVMDRGAEWVGGIGEMVIPPPPYEWTEVVNWMDEDFPDPGPYPVFFPIGDTQVYRLRMTLRPGETGPTYQALGEMYLFREPDRSERLGDNMMAWDTITVTATNSLSKPPLWNISYLNDGVTGLGMPLSEERSEVEDFSVIWDKGSRGIEPVVIEMDLGEVRPIGRVQLWPAEAPFGMAITHFGFPDDVLVELSNEPEFIAPERFEVLDVHERVHADNFLNVITGAKKARYIRIILHELSSYNGGRILSLGEIRVSEYDEIWSLNCAVSASGLPPEGMEQLSRLVDGYSRRRRILREVDWMEGLARRRPVDLRLAIVEGELEKALDDWNAFKLRASFWGGGLLCMGLLGALGLQRLQRRKVLKMLKTRITRDLHDEVGSNLGSITLAARRMERAGATPSELSELSLMAREASASLKDVVWVIDQVRIRLPELLKTLGERAERVLSGIELTLQLPDECPNLVVPLPFKRHLLMFFKEAVHNCARHANATAVQIAIAVQDGMLVLYMEDNGCGFDAESKQEGWGIDSMGKRAEELGGKMELKTAPGKGTTVTLSVPLTEISNKTDHEYKTSN